MNDYIRIGKCAGLQWLLLGYILVLKTGVAKGFDQLRYIYI